jgi:succinoglycan biosynthesis transport protein ExoP
MDLKRYIDILWRRKAIIILTAAVTLVVVAIGTYLATPVYEALSVLRVATSTGTQASSSVDYMYTDRLMNTYVEIATSRPVIIELTQRLDLTQPPNIKAEIVPNTELIKITVEHTNPQIAAMAANTLAEILIAQSNQLYSGGTACSNAIRYRGCKAGI